MARRAVERPRKSTAESVEAQTRIAIIDEPGRSEDTSIAVGFSPNVAQN